MEIRTLLSAAYDLQLERLRTLGEELEAENRIVEPDAPFVVEAERPIERVRLVDYVVAEDEGEAPRAVELAPGPVIKHPPLALEAEGVDLLVRAFAWDRVHLDFGPVAFDEETLGPVLARWHWDPETEAVPEAPGHIHSMRRVDNGLLIDLGTAPPEAFLELVASLRAAGVAEIAVTAE